MASLTQLSTLPRVLAHWRSMRSAQKHPIYQITWGALCRRRNRQASSHEGLDYSIIQHEALISSLRVQPIGVRNYRLLLLLRLWQLSQLEVCGLPTCIRASQHHEDSKGNGHRLPHFLLDEGYRPLLTSRLGRMVFKTLSGVGKQYAAFRFCERDALTERELLLGCLVCLSCHIRHCDCE